MKPEQDDTDPVVRPPVTARDSVASFANRPARLIVTSQTTVAVLISYATGDGLTLHSLERPLDFPCHVCQQRQEGVVVALHGPRLVCPACHALLAQSPAAPPVAATPPLPTPRKPTSVTTTQLRIPSQATATGPCSPAPPQAEEPRVYPVGADDRDPRRHPG